MTQQYYAILTDYGSQQLAQAIAARQPLDITHFAVGDGNGRETTPNPSYTALVQEVYRANISAVSKDPRNNQQVIFELTIPENVGGFYIREMGIFDAQNKLVGYANSPESFKPTEQSGSGKIQVIRMILRVSSSDAVQLTVDNSVIFATNEQLQTLKATLEERTDNLDFIPNNKKSSATNSNSEDTVATSKAVKDLNDSKVSKTGNETIQGRKTFESDTHFKSGVTISANSTHYNGNNRVYIGADSDNAHFVFGDDTLRLHSADNRISYNNHNIFHKAYKPTFANDIAEKPSTLAGYGITDFQVKTATGDLNTYRTAGIYAFVSRTNSSNRPGDFTGNLQVISGGVGNERWCHQTFKRHYSDETYERYQVSGDNDNWSEWKKVGSDGVPVGSVVAFPKEIASPQGFLRCDGTTFSQNTYPDLYRVLGNKNRLPNLTRSDVGQLAYFPTDTIPDGWIAFDSIRSVVNATSYPELYRYLIAKYRSISNVPLAEDRFIRNAGNGLNVGATQNDEIKKHTHRTPLSHNSNDYQQMSQYYNDVSPVLTAPFVMALDGSGGTNNVYARQKNNLAAEGGEETRPKSIVLKLCIKAKNSFEDVQFWIKAFSEVVNVGQLDASRLAQDLQQVRSEKANIDHTHTVSQIADFNPEVVKLINQHSGFTQQIAESGWTVLPNGLMLQWGVSNSTEIYFPRAFPVRCFVVSHSKTAGNRDTRVNNITNTKFNSYASSHPGTTYYIAIGH